LLSTTRVWVRRGTRLRSPILVVGFPGLGKVGKIALRHLVRSLGCELVGLLTSPCFSAHAIVTKDGSARLVRGEIYLKRLDSGQDLLLLTGDEHYEDITGEYEAAFRLLSFFKRRGGRMIITIGGHTTPSETPSAVFCFATKKALLDKALSAGAEKAATGTPIVGISGVLVGLAKIRKTPALCLLGETLGLMPDFKAAKNVLVVLTKILGLSVDLAPLEKGADSLADVVKELEKRYDALVQAPPLSKIVEESKGPGPDYVG
jgi:proteasome assembly chaperone (PAC2) family protein